MRAGLLRHRVAIQNPSMSVDNFGGRSASFSTAETVFASIDPVRGTELQNADQTKARITHKITMRFTSNVSATSRLVHDSRTFEVVEFLNRREIDQMIEIQAREMV
jgi:SPP1 family predicted phage head-tail adaptor